MGRMYDFDLSAEIIVVSEQYFFDTLIKNLVKLNIKYVDWQDNDKQKSFNEKFVSEILIKKLRFENDGAGIPIVCDNKFGSIQGYSKEDKKYLEFNGFGFDEKVHFEYEYEQDVPSAVELFLDILEPLPVKNINLWWELDLLRDFLNGRILEKNSFLLEVSMADVLDFFSVFESLNQNNFTLFPHPFNNESEDFVFSWFHLMDAFEMNQPYSFIVQNHDFGYKMHIAIHPNFIEAQILEPYALKKFGQISVIDIIYYLRPFIVATKCFGMNEIMTNFNEIA